MPGLPSFASARPQGVERAVKGTTGERVQRLIRPEVRRLNAYHVPDSAGMVKLDAMESPYPWPGDLMDAWLAALGSVTVNRYPDPAAVRLRGRLRAVMGVPEGSDILLGNGSDELIQLILLCLSRPGATVLAPEPSFVMYRLLALAAGMSFVGVPLRGDDFMLDPAAMLAAVKAHRPSVVFLAYPNNPTGNLFQEDVVRAILESTEGLVVMDEAYTPFADSSFLAALPAQPNLLLMRTVSKMGLAGLRLGWLAGDPAWINEFDKLRLPYNINVLSQISAEFALDHMQALMAQTRKIREDRERLYNALASLPGVTVWPSEANFLLFRLPSGRAVEIFQGLVSRGVLVKNLHASHPLLTDCLRVTVGTPEENAAFLDCLRALLR